jgi:hypothetical protein
MLAVDRFLGLEREVVVVRNNSVWDLVMKSTVHRVLLDMEVVLVVPHGMAVSQLEECCNYSQENIVLGPESRINQLGEYYSCS